MIIYESFSTQYRKVEMEDVINLPPESYVVIRPALRSKGYCKLTFSVDSNNKELDILLTAVELEAAVPTLRQVISAKLASYNLDWTIVSLKQRTMYVTLKEYDVIVQNL